MPLSLWCVVVVGAFFGACAVPDATFLITVENISDQSELPTPLAPGVFVLHDESFALFENNAADKGLGLEALAEDGHPALLADNIAFASGVAQSGVFAIPTEGDTPAPLLPGGGSYQFEVRAGNNAQYISFATMFVESNDLFFAPNDTGIKLYRLGRPISGDITGKIKLWDASTEVNEKPGEGANQPPRQLGPDTGLSETGDVRTVSDTFNYPAVSKLIQVTVTVTDIAPDTTPN